MHLFQAAQVTLKLTELQSQDCLLKQLQFGTEFGRAFVSALLGVSQGDLNLGWYTHCGHDAFNPTWEAEADRSLCKFKADVMFNHMCQLIWLDHSTQYLAKCYPGCFYKGFFFFFLRRLPFNWLLVSHAYTSSRGRDRNAAAGLRPVKPISWVSE